MTRLTQQFGPIGQRLGRGGFGSVYALGNHHVLKIVESNHLTPDMIAELVCSARLRGSDYNTQLIAFDIVKISGLFQLQLVIPRAEGDLFDSISNQHVPTDPTKWVWQICYAVYEMHSYNIMHRDIKPENVLIYGDTLKMTDYGLAKFNICPVVERLRNVYTVVYRPPELFEAPEKYRTYDFSADIWALGVTIYEIVIGSTTIFDPRMFPQVLPQLPKPPKQYGIPRPYSKPQNSRQEEYNQIIRNINAFIYNKTEVLQRVRDPQLRAILNQIFQFDPNRRPNIHQIMSSKYFAEQVPMELSCFDSYVVNGLGSVERFRRVDLAIWAKIIARSRDTANRATLHFGITKVESRYVSQMIIYLYAYTSWMIRPDKYVRLHTQAVSQMINNHLKSPDDLIPALFGIVYALTYGIPLTQFNQLGQIQVLLSLDGTLGVTIADDFRRILDRNSTEYWPISQGLTEINTQQTFVDTPLPKLILKLFEQNQVLSKYSDIFVSTK